MAGTHVELLLDELALGKRRIAELCAYDLRDSFFLGLWIDEDDIKKRTDEVLTLMARNYAISEELEGQNDIQFLQINDEARQEKKTLLDYVRPRLAKTSQSPKQSDDFPWLF